MNIKETQQYKDLPDYHFQWAIDKIIEGCEILKTKEAKVNRQLDVMSNFSPAQPLKDYIPHPKVWSDLYHGAYNYYIHGGSYTRATHPLVTEDQLNEWLQQNEVIYKENLLICENNRKVKEVALAFLIKLGFKEKKYDYASSRKKNKEWVSSAWFGEFQNHFVVSCDYTWNEFQRWAKQQIDGVKKYNLEKEIETKRVAEEQVIKLKAAEKTALIVKIVEKYKLDFNEPIPNVGDVILRLAEKNKYLFLAYYLFLNRSDWNDGSNYASIGIGRFCDFPATGIDNDIISCITDLINDWEGDGRVFRDCEWNYDRLFSIVKEQDPELNADWEKLLIHREY